MEDCEPVTIFDDMLDVESFVYLLCGYDEDYDHEAIARQATDWVDGRLTLVVTGEDFWSLIRSHRI